MAGGFGASNALRLAPRFDWSGIRTPPSHHPLIGHLHQRTHQKQSDRADSARTLLAAAVRHQVVPQSPPEPIVVVSVPALPWPAADQSAFQQSLIALHQFAPWPQSWQPQYRRSPQPAADRPSVLPWLQTLLEPQDVTQPLPSGESEPAAV